MTGPHDGGDWNGSRRHREEFLDGMPARFEVAQGNVQMNCVLIETDEAGPRNAAGRLPAKSIARLRLRID